MEDSFLKQRSGKGWQKVMITNDCKLLVTYLSMWELFVWEEEFTWRQHEVWLCEVDFSHEVNQCREWVVLSEHISTGWPPLWTEEHSWVRYYSTHPRTHTRKLAIHSINTSARKSSLKPAVRPTWVRPAFLTHFAKSIKKLCLCRFDYWDVTMVW